LEYKRTPKALFRRAQANRFRKDFENAIRDLEEALTLVPSADEDMKATITKELDLAKHLDKEYDK